MLGTELGGSINHIINNRLITRFYALSQHQFPIINIHHGAEMEKMFLQYKI